MSTTSNPVIEVYRGIEIRRYNRFTMRLDQRSYREIIDAAQDNNISIRKAICLSSSPCKECTGIEVKAYSNGEVISVPRGLISKHIPSLVIPRKTVSGDE